MSSTLPPTHPHQSRTRLQAGVEPQDLAPGRQTLLLMQYLGQVRLPTSLLHQIGAALGVAGETLVTVTDSVTDSVI
jgi:hypothetical protein